MNESPQSGILTFLFTDLEDSTRLWDQFPEAMQPVVARHDTLLKTVVEAHDGQIVKTTGDGLHAVFESATDAVAAALAGQRSITSESWPDEMDSLKVRMGLHSGESLWRDGDYYGSDVNLAAGVMSLGHGGQILLSEATRSLTRKTLPQDCTLVDLGQHRLKGVVATEQIYQLSHPELDAAFPPLKSLAAFDHNLPRQLSRFIGREKELAQVKRLLEDTQLLTLLGPGGTGKTRLMLQVGEEVIEDYPDGVWLVELAPLTDPDLIPERIAAALNVQEQPGQALLDTLATYLRRKELLLLLDNIEHVVRESAVIAEYLLKYCPRLKFLVTGREALFIAGEATLQIPSLTLPELSQNLDDIDKLAEFEAIQLFLDRARAVRPDFALRPENAPAIVEIVRRLDGIPLALELAAARLRMLSVEKIADRLSDRFRLLTGGRRTALPRQQTLEALIDWSWQLLDDNEQILLQRLSVFSGGWSLEAAEGVCGFEPLDSMDVFDFLDQLINKSLVTAEFPLEGEPRYDMLESIRQFARNRLFAAGEGESLRDRHAAYFVALTEAADEELYKREAMNWIRQLRLDLDNIRAVMAWTLEERPGLALRLTGHLRHNQGYWMANREAETWLSAVITQTRPLLDSGDGTIDPGDFIKALVAYSFALVGLGQNLKIIDYLDEAIALARQHNEVRLLAFAIGMSGFVHTFNITPEKIRDIEEAIQICRRHNFLHELAWNLSFLGGAYYLAGNLEKGEPYIEEALQIRLDLGSPRQIATVLETRAGIAWLRGDLEQAREFTLQAIEHLETLGARQNLTMSQSRLAHIHRAAGEFDKAEAIYRYTILRWQEHGNIPAVAHQIECFAFIAMGRGNDRLGARLIGAAKTARERLNAPSINPLEITDMNQAMSRLTEVMDEEALEIAMAEGAELSLDDAVLLALKT